MSKPIPPVTAFPFLLAVLMLAPLERSYGDMVYSLNNYPNVQDGGSLSGSITVSDDARDDGVLSEDEILAWEWSASDSAGTLSLQADSVAPSRGQIIQGDIPIDSDHIRLPKPTTVHETNLLILDGEFGVADTTERLVWFQIYWRDPSLYTGVYSAFKREFDVNEGSVETVLWRSLELPPDALGGDPWIIATIVPEPGTLTLISLGLMGLLAGRQRKRNGFV